MEGIAISASDQRELVRGDWPLKSEVNLNYRRN